MAEPVQEVPPSEPPSPSLPPQRSLRGLRIALGVSVALNLLVPYPESDRLDYIRQFGRIDTVAYETAGVRLRVQMDPDRVGPLLPYLRLAQSEPSE